MFNTHDARCHDDVFWTLGEALIILVATSSVVMLVVIVVIVVFCRRRMQVAADAVTSTDTSDCSRQHDDSERLLPTNDLVQQSVDDDDDDDVTTSSSSSRLDFDVTRLSLNSRRCLVETDEVDSEGISSSSRYHVVYLVLCHSVISARCVHCCATLFE